MTKALFMWSNRGVLTQLPWLQLSLKKVESQTKLKKLMPNIFWKCFSQLLNYFQEMRMDCRYEILC